MANNENLANLVVQFDLKNDQFIQKTKQTQNAMNSLSNSGVSPMQNKLNGLSGNFNKLSSVMGTLGFSQLSNAFSSMGKATTFVSKHFNKIESTFTSLKSKLNIGTAFNPLIKSFNSVKTTVSSVITSFAGIGKNVLLHPFSSLQKIFPSLISSSKSLLTTLKTMGSISFGSMMGAGAVGTGSIFSGTFMGNLMSKMKVNHIKGIFKSQEYIVNYMKKTKPNAKFSDWMDPFTLQTNLSPMTKIKARFSDLSEKLKGMFSNISFSGVLGSLKNVLLSVKALNVVLSLIIIPPLLFFGFKKLAEWIGRATEHLDKLAKDAKKLQVPSEALKSWQIMGEYAGFAPEAIETAIKTMNRSLSTAQMGSKRKSLAFDMTGLSIKDIRGADNPLVAMETILRRISNLSSSGKKLMALSEIFGPVAAQELLKVIDDIDETMARIKSNADLSIYADLSSVEEFQDRVTDLNLQWTNLKDSFKKTIGILLGEFFVGVAWGAGVLAKDIAHLIALPFWKLGDLYRFFNPGDIDIDKFERELRDKLENQKKQQYLLSDEEIPLKLEEYLTSIKQPLDIYKERLNEVDELLERGIITQSDYDSILEKMKSDIIQIVDPLEEYAKQMDLLNQYLDLGIINEKQFDIRAKELYDTLTNGNEALKLSSELVDKYSDSLSKAMTSLAKLNDAKVGVQLPNGDWLGGLSQETVDLEKKSIMKDLIKSFEEDGDKLKNITGFISDTLLNFERDTIDGLDFSKFKEVLSEELTKEFSTESPLDKLNSDISNLTTLMEMGVLPLENYNVAIQGLYDQLNPDRNNLDEFTMKLQGIRKEFENGAITASQFGREVMDTVGGYQISDPTEMYNSMNMLTNQRTGMPDLQFQEGLMNIFGQLENNAVNSMGKINAAMDLLYMGQITRNEAFMMLSSIFNDIEDQAIELERSLMMEDITPQFFEQKFAPLFGILQTLNSIAAFEPSMNFFKLQDEKFQNWQNMMSQNMEAMNAMSEQYPAPWGMGPGIHTKFNPGEGGGGGSNETETSPGLYTASQIKGVLTSSKYQAQDYERTTAENTKTLVELFTRITYGHGGIYSLG